MKNCILKIDLDFWLTLKAFALFH